MKMVPKNKVELQKMAAAGELAARVLDMIGAHVRPGVTTLHLNDLCHAFIEKHNATPAPLGYKGYPKATCISVNEVVCHGIPHAETVLREGDILNIDVTVILAGFHGDTSRMYGVGEVAPAARKLVRVTHDAMMAGIATVKSGSLLTDIGAAIQAVTDPHGYGVVREYCGHGLGRKFHEDPQVLHYANYEFGKTRLRRDVTLTIEPMVNIGTWRTELMPDGWTVKTADRTLSAQYEHTLAVGEHGPVILTTSPEFGEELPLLA
jgi:methionyl aminopeptidase